MKFNLHGHLTPSQRAVIGFVGATTRWLTVREIALATGIALGGSYEIVWRLEQLGQVTKRHRRGGFDNGILEYRRSTNISIRPNHLFVVPLRTRLRDYLTADRAREAENY